jgi:2-keto-4-pentenoate hydratase/2-oxohepta-3-ene-1,7-dioic acid hydratase in catechol pathway
MTPEHVVLAQATHAHAWAPRPWLVHGSRALPLSAAAPGHAAADARSIHELLVSWAGVAPVLQEMMESPSTLQAIRRSGTELTDLAVTTPVRPAQTFCTIGNYAAQVVESAVDAGDGPHGRGAAARRDDALRQIEERRRTGQPYTCLTSSHRVTGPYGDLVIPADVDTLDWEVEIAAVLGAGVDGAPVVAGYCVANDLTVRSRVFRTDFAGMSDWVQSKGMPGSLPIGPWFVPAWQVPAVAELRLQLSLNGTLMQDDVAADMVFDVNAQIDYLSRHTVVSAGDIVCTGSPAGFGAHHQRFLRPGDEVRARVQGLGEQVLTCVAAVPATSGRRADDLDCISPERSIANV